MDIAALGFKVDASQLTQATTAVNTLAGAATKAAPAAARVGTALTASGAAAATTGSVFQRYGSQIQNTSYQLQDMVVQISMGTGAMRAMSMQLPQMLGGFGAWGAMIGVAVGVLGGLAPMLMGVEEESSELKDTLRDLANAQSTYADAADLAKTSLADLWAEFGRNALAARDLYSAMKDIALLEYSQQITKSTQAIKGEIEGINRLVSMHKAATIALGSSAKTAFALNAQAVKELREEYGLTLPQAQRLTDALKDIDNASTALEQANGMKAFADAVAEAVRSGSEIPPHILEAARNAADLAAQGYRVAAATDQANASTGAAIANTNSWASAMAGVAAQINAIAGALASIGGGMISRAAMFVERNAIAAGKSVAQARVEVEKFKVANEWDARIMGAKSKGGILGAVAGKALEAAKAVDLSNVAMAAENVQLMESARVAERAAGASAKRGGASKKAAGGAKESAAATRDLIGEINREYDAKEALIGLYGEELERAEALQKVQSKLGDDIGKYSRDVIQATADRIVAIEREADAWETQVDRITNLTDDLSGAFGDWMSRGLRDFKEFAGDILSSFQRMISDMIATAVRNPIQIALQGVALGGGATGAAAAPTGGVAQGILGKIGSGIGTAISSAIGGFTSVVGGLVKGGLSGATSALTTAIGGATSGIAGLATAAGAIAAPLAAVAAVFSFFKKSTKELDRGLRVTVDGMDALIETFRRTETKRFWGLSKSRKTSYDAASPDIADPIDKALGNVQKSVLDAAKALNIGQDAFSSFAYQFKLSTKDMTDEQALAAIQGEIGKFGDAFAAMVPGLQKFAAEGEGLSATLSRLSTSLATVNGSLADLGLALFQTSVSGAGAASAFADLFGGLDAFATASGAYYQAFFTDAERMARLQETATAAIRDAGLAVPATREAYRQLVEAQDMATEAGQRAVAVLIQFAPAFAQVFDAVAQANATRQDLLFSLLDEQQQAAFAQQQVQAAFASLNMTVPTTLAGLRAVIAGLDLTGQAGRDALATIASVAAQLKQTLTTTTTTVTRSVSSGGGSSSVDNSASNAEAERERLQRRLLELQGNTLALRRMELQALDPANRALQEMVWRLEDAREAMDSLGTSGFATLVDYELARAKAANANSTPGALPVAERKAREAREMRDSEALDEMRQYMREVVNNTHRTARETRDLRVMQEYGVVA